MLPGCHRLLVQFNAGSAGGAGVIAGQAFLTTNAAAASAMLTFMLCDILRGRKMRATGACIGAIIGLVVITPAAGAYCTSCYSWGEGPWRGCAGPA